LDEFNVHPDCGIANINAGLSHNMFNLNWLFELIESGNGTGPTSVHRWDDRNDFELALLGDRLFDD
jgi:hypothetical protein